MLQRVSNQKWRLQQIQAFCGWLTRVKEIETKVVEYFSSVLENYLRSEQLESDPERMCEFLSSTVDFLLLIPPNKSGQCFLVNGIFKNILNAPPTQRYLAWCDENWRINEFDIQQKIEKINMEDKLKVLHKNSSFYYDILTLTECKATLAEAIKAGRPNDTSKKVAISFIHSCLVSNNLNKIYAVYRSGVLSGLHCFGGK
jgi:hypothetical protein